MPFHFTCERCNEGFTAKQQKHRRYCSKKCSDLANRRNIKAAMNRPEVREKMRDSALTTPKTGHRVEMTCDQCGIIFWQYGSKRTKEHKFCKRACSLEWQSKKNIIQADIETAAPTKPTEEKFLVKYDPKTKTLTQSE